MLFIKLSPAAWYREQNECGVSVFTGNAALGSCGVDLWVSREISLSLVVPANTLVSCLYCICVILAFARSVNTNTGKLLIKRGWHEP